MKTLIALALLASSATAALADHKTICAGEVTSGPAMKDSGVDYGNGEAGCFFDSHSRVGRRIAATCFIGDIEKDIEGAHCRVEAVVDKYDRIKRVVRVQKEDK